MCATKQVRDIQDIFFLTFLTFSLTLLVLSYQMLTSNVTSFIQLMPGEASHQLWLHYDILSIEIKVFLIDFNCFYWCVSGNNRLYIVCQNYRTYYCQWNYIFGIFKERWQYLVFYILLSFLKNNSLQNILHVQYKLSRKICTNLVTLKTQG